MSRNSLLEAGAKSEGEVTATGFPLKIAPSKNAFQYFPFKKLFPQKFFLFKNCSLKKYISKLSIENEIKILLSKTLSM